MFSTKQTFFGNTGRQDVLWSWGTNGINGQLGDYTTTCRSSPVSVVGGFTDWTQISAKGNNSVGLREDGTIWWWGAIVGIAPPSRSPTCIISSSPSWKCVSTGYNHVLMLNNNGTLWGIGNNGLGQIGDGNNTPNVLFPTQNVTGFDDWNSISAGDRFSVGSRENGTLWTWGYNDVGQLGDGTLDIRSSPVSVIGGFTDWCQVSAGKDFTAAVRANGTLWTWGCNGGGKLGDNSTVNKSSPVSVPSGVSSWKCVSAGGTHALAQRNDGFLLSWGCNTNGQLGDSSKINRSSPVGVGENNWIDISAGGCSSAGIRDNTVWTWGNNNFGRLGTGDASDRSFPTSVVGGFSDWCRVTVGACHMIAMRSIT